MEAPLYQPSVGRCHFRSGRCGSGVYLLFLIRVSRAHSSHALLLGYCILEHLSADLFSFLGTGLVL